MSCRVLRSWRSFKVSIRRWEIWAKQCPIPLKVVFGGVSRDADGRGRYLAEAAQTGSAPPMTGAEGPAVAGYRANSSPEFAPG